MCGPRCEARSAAADRAARRLPAQHLERRLAQFLSDLWHHLLGEVEQEEPNVRGVEAHLLGRRVGHGAQLRDQLGARIRRADHDDRAPGRRHLRVVLDGGQLELLDEVVTEAESLRGGLQPPRMRREPRHVEQPRHGPRREHQPVPGHGVAALFGVANGQGVPLEVHAVHPAAHRTDPFERVRQGNRDEARIDQPAGDSGEAAANDHN